MNKETVSVENKANENSNSNTNQAIKSKIGENIINNEKNFEMIQNNMELGI